MFNDEAEAQLAVLNRLSLVQTTAMVDEALLKSVRQGGDELHDMARLLESTAIAMLRKSRYILTRIGYDGCGLKEHDEGVNDQNNMIAKVRKALGYCVPRNDIRW